MNESHSRAIVFLLAAILCVMLFGASTFLSGMAWGAGIAALIGAVFLLIVGSLKLFSSLRNEIRMTRSQGEPWLFLPVLWTGLLGVFALFGVAGVAWVSGHTGFLAAFWEIPYVWLPGAFIGAGLLIGIAEGAPHWLPRAPERTFAFFRGWFYLFAAPIFGPLGRIRAIREARTQGENIGHIAAGASVMATFFAAVLLWLGAVLMPLLALLIVVHGISR